MERHGYDDSLYAVFQRSYLKYWIGKRKLIKNGEFDKMPGITTFFYNGGEKQKTDHSLDIHPKWPG